MIQQQLKTADCALDLVDPKNRWACVVSTVVYEECLVNANSAGQKADARLPIKVNNNPCSVSKPGGSRDMSHHCTFSSLPTYLTGLGTL